MTFYSNRNVGIYKNITSDDSIGYAEDSKAIVYFAHEVSKRAVGFKAFLNNFSLNVDFGVDEEKTTMSPIAQVYQGASTFNYSVDISVPGFSAMESKANLAKFQELSRYIVNRKSFNLADDEKVSYVYVLFANLIQNGLYSNASSGTRDIKNWQAIKDFGAKCYITSINFEADIEAGFFDIDSLLVPKSYNLSMTLFLQPEFKDSAGSLRYSVMGFVPEEDSIYNELDTVYWPFGITLADRFSSAITHQIFGEDGSGLYARNKGAMVGFADEIVSKFVAYKAFLENFSYKKEVEVNSININSSKGTGTFQLGGDVREQVFSLAINVPSHSVNEARANLAKIQNLVRFAISKDESDEWGRFEGGHFYVYFQNLISKSHLTSTGNALSRKYIIENGLKCIVRKLQFSFDLEMGFFEFNGFLLPKVYKLDLELRQNDIEETDGGSPGAIPLEPPETLDETQQQKALFDRMHPFGIKY